MAEESACIESWKERWGLLVVVDVEKKRGTTIDDRKDRISTQKNYPQSPDTPPSTNKRCCHGPWREGVDRNESIDDWMQNTEELHDTCMPTTRMRSLSSDFLLFSHNNSRCFLLHVFSFLQITHIINSMKFTVVAIASVLSCASAFTAVSMISF